MSLLVETIHIKQGKVPLLKYHQSRFDQSRYELFGIAPNVLLQDFILTRHPLQEVKCRILYDTQIRKVEYHPVQKRKIKTLKIIENDQISYDHKYMSRPGLDDIWSQKGAADEVIIVKNKNLTDAYYFNMILFDGSNYYTPSDNLLPGTMRQFLIDNKKITPCRINVKNLTSFRNIILINALTPIEEIVLPIAAIIR